MTFIIDSILSEGGLSGTTLYGSGDGITSLPSNIDRHITGFTYNNNVFTISSNYGSAQTLTSTINSMTGLTINGPLSASTVSGGTFYGNGSGLTGVIIPSSAKSYGEMFLTNNTTETVISSTGVPFKLAGTTVAGELNLFTMSTDNRLEYTGSTTGLSFSINVNISAVAAASNQLFELSIQKNGTPQTNTIMQMQFGSTDQAVGLSGIVRMNPGDYVEVWVQNNTSNKNFTAKYLSFTLSQV